MLEESTNEDLRQAQFNAWLENGSDDMRDAWVSVCSCATTHEVQDFRLAEVVDAVGKGHIKVKSKYGGTEISSLNEQQSDVRRLYQQGVAEAEHLNKGRIRKIVEHLGLKVNVESVEPIIIQPKGNEKKFVITGIKVGGETHKAPDGYAHIKPEALGKKEADAAKKEIPCVTFAGVFRPERNADYLVRPTGLYILDFDAVRDLATTLKVIRADSNVAIAFISITGSGLKVCVRGPIARTSVEYCQIYERLAALKSNAWGLQAEVDRATKDCSRLCFLPHDPDVYVNWDAKALTLEDLPEPPPSLKSEPKSGTPKKQPLNGATTKTADLQSSPEQPPVGLPLEIDWGDVPNVKWDKMPLARCLDALRYVDPCCDRETWRSICVALKNGYGDQAFSFFDLWSSRGGSAYNGSEDCRKLWDGHRREGGKLIKPPTVLWLAKKNGWKSTMYQGSSGTAPASVSNGEVAGVELDEQGRILLRLFGTGVPAGEFCSALYGHMKQSGRVYVRGGQVCQIVDDPEVGKKIERVDPAGMVTFIEKFAQVYTVSAKGERLPTSISERACRIIINAGQRYDLPPLESLVEAPVLCEINGQPLLVESGYNRDLRAFVLGKHKLAFPETMEGAVSTILNAIEHYEFATANDKSRAVAALITPALKLGSFIKGHVPMPMFEADESQSGKTLLAGTCAAVYGECPSLVAQRKNGVGSVDESIGKALLKGHPFVILDNWRGDLDSQFVECLLTGNGRVDVRALRASGDVDVNRYIFAVTSNGMSATKDLCNRMSLIRIKKRRGHKFPLYAEGCLPDHIRADFGKYLGAIYFLIRKWHEAGKPRTDELRHSFVEWAGAVDWIVQIYFKLPKLLDGHLETLVRVEHPYLAALRQICLEVDRRDKLRCHLRAHDLADLALAAHIDLGRGVAAGDDGMAMAVGKIMANSFAALEEAAQGGVEFEGFFVRRREELFDRYDARGTKRGWEYQFSREPFTDKWASERASRSHEY